MANLGTAWHLPTNPEPPGRAGMRDPVLPTAPLDAVTIVSGNQFAGTGNPGNQLQLGSELMFRVAGAAWTSTPLAFAAELGNNKYFSAAVPTAGLGTGVSVDYYLRLAYDDHDTTFLLANVDGFTSSTTGDEEAARAAPFSFTLDPLTLRGRWEPVFLLPNVAIHTHVLPDGRVLMWGRRDSPAQSLDTEPPGPLTLGGPVADAATCTPFIWQPDTGTHGRGAEVTTTPTGPTPPRAGGGTVNLFCSGHAFLPDGRLLVAGGHLADGNGPAQTCLFDPGTGQWTASATMGNGRWYPTLTTLPDGSVLILAGSFGPQGAQHNTVPEIWTAGTLNRISESPVGAWDLYPRLHVTRGPRVVATGSLQQTWVLDLPAGTWSEGPLKTDNGQRDYAPSVLYDTDKVLYIGGGSAPTANADLLDLTTAQPVWTPAKAMAFPRRQHNATILADGTVLVTGGTRSGGATGSPEAFNNLDPGQPIHVAELWNPATKTWQLLAAEDVDRCYHSTAVLLPDATVLSAGGGEFFPIEGRDANDPADSHRDGQIFTPPYLCTGGSQPLIASAPDSTTYGATFHVETPEPQQIAKVTWIRLSSVTHSFNTGQRYTELASSPTGTGLDVTTPASADICPPGHYMMFLIDRHGVPSVAKIMRIALTGPAPVAARTPARAVQALRHAVPARTTGRKVVVGLRGTCPYGIGACWGGAHEALQRLDGVEAVDPVPDAVGSTAAVYVADGLLPDLETWRAELRAIVHESYAIRGVELHITGALLRQGNRLDLITGSAVVHLAPLDPASVVQWDRETRKPRAATTAEIDAHSLLAAGIGSSTNHPVTVTGPLQQVGGVHVLQVRAWNRAGPQTDS
ncbi:glyoxal oxidase [Pseudonocardia sp.]|uniref:glyoxal oxidase n=1 Tax=Pseudonocardia sp. TaxID=60912 RepID=UPI002631933A|nr:glyoxal oxidase [Pseudonocardia sp.]MCW2719963.1 Glyoxal oxidase N-terminus [Pseudonocardia sp.]